MMNDKLNKSPNVLKTFNKTTMLQYSLYREGALIV